jgi:hypothetical protein
MPGDIWKSLSDEQKKEVLVSYEESEDAINLIALKEVIKRTKLESYLQRELKKIII